MNENPPERTLFSNSESIFPNSLSIAATNMIVGAVITPSPSFINPSVVLNPRSSNNTDSEWTRM